MEDLDQLLQALEQRVSNLKRLGDLMDQMKGVTSKFQEMKDDDTFKDLIEIKDLDEWSFALVRNLQDIEQNKSVTISRARESLQTKEYDFLNLGNIKRAIEERGLKVVSDAEIQLYFNNVVMIGINNLLSKTKAREMAKRVVGKAIKKGKRKKSKKKKSKKKK